MRCELDSVFGHAVTAKLLNEAVGHFSAGAAPTSDWRTDPCHAPIHAA